MSIDGLPLPMGISARTGRPLSGFAGQDMKSLGLTQTIEAQHERLLQGRASRPLAYGGAGGIDMGDLTQTGWGVLCPPALNPAIMEALQPLLTHRRNEVGDALYRVFSNDSGYQAGETAQDWLRRQGVSAGPVQPERGVPFYILIVAPPTSIPFEFQYALDVYWGVGRIWFDTPEEFGRYAESVVAYERAAALTQSRQIAMFAPMHDFDEATQLFHRVVATPLNEGEGSVKPVGTGQRFRRQPFLGDAATKNALIRVLQGKIDHGPPAVLFTGSHGMQFDESDPRQHALQGALVCQDWEGYGKINEDVLFGASAVPDDANVHGMVHFLFACHGAGCSEFDDFDRLNGQPRRMADQKLLAALPKRLLSHPKGGALAVVGHVERAWASSFQDEQGMSQTGDFMDVLGRIMAGFRLGYALDTFNMRWAERSIALSEAQLKPAGTNADARRLANLWVARDDARNYILLGDPAVRLRLERLQVLD